MYSIRLPLRASSGLAHQRGAGMVGFAIVILPVLLIGLGSIELTHWFFTRQAVSLALLDAGRAAITGHNHPDRIIQAFEAALRPLYASSSPRATDHRLNKALADRKHHLNAAPWQIELLSPSALAYADFAASGLHVVGTSGQAAINNNYLAEQDRRNRARGWADGRGPVSGQTIYDANTAVLRLSWPHQPRLPLVVPLLRALGDVQGSYRQRALAHGYLPMTRQITMLMQSHPVQWSNSADGKIIAGSESSLNVPGCTGWLCDDGHDDRTTIPIPGFDASAPASPGSPGTSPGDTGTPDPAHADAGPDPDGSTPDYSGLEVDPDNPACGVVLCCV